MKQEKAIWFRCVSHSSFVRLVDMMDIKMITLNGKFMLTENQLWKA